MYDKRPAIIVRCASAADVMHSVAFVGEHRVLVAVKSGGHHIAGKRFMRRRFVDRSLLDEIRSCRRAENDRTR